MILKVHYLQSSTTPKSPPRTSKREGVSDNSPTKHSLRNSFADNGIYIAESSNSTWLLPYEALCAAFDVPSSVVMECIGETSYSMFHNYLSEFIRDKNWKPVTACLDEQIFFDRVFAGNRWPYSYHKFVFNPIMSNYRQRQIQALGWNPKAVEFLKRVDAWVQKEVARLKAVESPVQEDKSKRVKAQIRGQASDILTGKRKISDFSLVGGVIDSGMIQAQQETLSCLPYSSYADSPAVQFLAQSPITPPFALSPIHPIQKRPRTAPVLHFARPPSVSPPPCSLADSEGTFSFPCPLVDHGRENFKPSTPFSPSCLFAESPLQDETEGNNGESQMGDGAESCFVPWPPVPDW